MRKVYPIVLIFLLTAPSVAGDLASSFKQAAALADAQPTDRATRVYDKIDLVDYYRKKYTPVFQSCLKSTDNTSPLSFVVAIGADGRVLGLYADHETKCLRVFDRPC